MIQQSSLGIVLPGLAGIQAPRVRDDTRRNEDRRQDRRRRPRPFDSRQAPSAVPPSRGPVGRTLNRLA
jgi:hypothetical protein